MTSAADFAKNLGLGKPTSYPTAYDPKQLVPVPRSLARESLAEAPFYGADIWNGYEVSWLNRQGQPQIATAEFMIDCASPNLIESKSFKLYLNSFNNHQFDSLAEVQACMQADLSAVAAVDVSVSLNPATEWTDSHLPAHLPGINLDRLSVECQHYTPQPDSLAVTPGEEVEQTLSTDAFMSLCLATGQPDWASVAIHYRGQPIDQAGLLQYLISFRQHQAFHEMCIEQIFVEIWQYCQPSWLSVEARFTRRGGLDINPIRSSEPLGSLPENQRLWRQ